MIRRASVLVALTWLIAYPLAAQFLFTAVGSPNPDGEPPVGTNALYDVTIDLDVLASNPAFLTVDLPSGQVTLTQVHFDPIVGFDESGDPLPVPSSERHYTWSGTGDGYQAAITHFQDCTAATFWGPTPYSLTLKEGATPAESLASQHVLRATGTPTVPMDAPEPAPAAGASEAWKPRRSTPGVRPWELAEEISAKLHTSTKFEILVLYTDAALVGMGSVLNAECIAEHGVTEINEYLRNSIVLATGRTVGVELLPGFVESNDGNEDLDRIQDDDHIRARRTALSADVVSVLFRSWAFSPLCGLAFTQRPGCANTFPIPGCEPGLPFASHAIFWASWDCVRDFGTGPHEFGHLNSAEHQDPFAVPAGARAFPWNSAHAFPEGAPDRQTGMYIGWDFQRIPHYSDSQVTHEGAATGIADERENARGIRSMITLMPLFGTVIHADGFESGDLTGWSAAEGDSP